MSGTYLHRLKRLGDHLGVFDAGELHIVEVVHDDMRIFPFLVFDVKGNRYGWVNERDIVINAGEIFDSI